MGRPLLKKDAKTLKSKKMPFLETLAADAATQVAQGAISGGMGILFGKANDRRQLKQQEKLQALQIQGQKQMGEFNFQKQLELWNATNYGAQMKHLTEAGLNPGLIYGMGGAGGATASITPGNVTGANAPVGGGEMMGMMQMGLLASQRKLMEAQAKKTEVEANKIAGVDTEKTQTEIKSLTQGITNQKAQQKLTEAETALKNLQTAFENETFDDRADAIMFQAQTAMELYHQAERETFIKRATANDIVDTIKSEAIGAALQNILTRQQTKLTTAQIDETFQKIDTQRKMIQQWTKENMLEWDKFDNEKKRTEIMKLLQQFHTDPVNFFGGQALGVLTNMLNGLSAMGKGRTVIEGFKKPY